MYFLIGIFFISSFFSSKAMEEHKDYGSLRQHDIVSIVTQAKTIQKTWRDTKDEKLLYASYKKMLKNFKKDEVSDDEMQPQNYIPIFDGVDALLSVLPTTKKLSGMRSCCGLIDTNKLKSNAIEKNLDEYYEKTQKIIQLPLFSQSPDTEILKRNCINFRRCILHYFSLRVKKYHAEKVSYADALIPITCATCGSADCAFGTFACIAINPLLGFVCCATALLEMSAYVTCNVLLANGQAPRCQELCITSEDFEKFMHVKELLNKSDQKHKQLLQ